MRYVQIDLTSVRLGGREDGIECPLTKDVSNQTGHSVFHLRLAGRFRLFRFGKELFATQVEEDVDGGG